MAVLLYICCIFSEHLFHRAPLGGCFCIHNGPNPIQHLQSPYLKYDTGLRKDLQALTGSPSIAHVAFSKKIYTKSRSHK